MTEDILNEHAERQGWNDASKIALLCRYIENQQCDDAFEDFLKQISEEEQG